MQLRHQQLLDLVNNNKRIPVAELSQKLGVSEVTTRKDLSLLEKAGLLRREHGFAVMISSDDITHHLAFNYDTKHAIAKQAAQTILNGETVMIESGACCALLARELAATRRDITIVTNSAFIAAFIRKAPFARVLLLGGDFQNEAQVMVGPLLKKCLVDFSIDKFFIGTDGFSLNCGFMGNNLLRAEAIRTMGERANKIMILTESTKFTVQGVIPQLKTAEIHSVFTDEAIPAAIKEHLENQHCLVHLSSKQSRQKSCVK